MRYFSYDGWLSWGHVPDDDGWRGTLLRWEDGGSTFFPVWGDYSPDHIYAVLYTGTGGNLRFWIYDNYYGDNSGSLSVTISRVPEPPGNLVCLLGAIGVAVRLKSPGFRKRTWVR